DPRARSEFRNLEERAMTDGNAPALLQLGQFFDAGVTLHSWATAPSLSSAIVFYLPVYVSFVAWAGTCWKRREGNSVRNIGGKRITWKPTDRLGRYHRGRRLPGPRPSSKSFPPGRSLPGSTAAACPNSDRNECNTGVARATDAR